MKRFFLLLFFASTCGAGYFYLQQNKAKEQISDFSKTLPAYEQTVTAKRADFQAYVRLLELQKKLQTKKGELATIQLQEMKLKQTLAVLMQERSEIVAQTRQAFVGKVIPEMVLADGRKLVQPKVLKVDDSGLSISMPSGVQKVAPAEMSDELRQSLYYRK